MRWLCRFGWHRWWYGIDMYNRKIYMVRYCRVCDKVEEVPQHLRDPRHAEVVVPHD